MQSYDSTVAAAEPRLLLAGIWVSVLSGGAGLALMLAVTLGGLRASRILDACGAHWATTPNWLEFIDLTSAAALGLAVMLRLRLTEWRALEDLRGGRAF